MMRASMAAGSIAALLQITYMIWSDGVAALELAHVVQMIASTPIAEPMLRAGLPMVIFGGLVHWVIALISAFGLIVLAQIVPIIFQFPMAAGSIYGIGVNLGLSYGVPLLVGAAYTPPALTSQSANLIAAAVLFGMPMALMARRMMRG